jgi:hypothetical protein
MCCSITDKRSLSQNAKRTNHASSTPDRCDTSSNNKGVIWQECDSDG